MTDRRKICLTPQVRGVAGPAAFQQRLTAGLQLRGIEITYDARSRDYGAVLVTGGTRNLATLRRARKAGVPILQRLNGINWIHRRKATGLRHFLRAELNNLLLRYIRDRLADRVVYQSQFAAQWWEREFGPPPVPSSIVYNAVPLDEFTPEGLQDRPEDRVRLLMVEGNLAGGYEVGLEHGAGMAASLEVALGEKVELTVAGWVPREVKRRWEEQPEAEIQWLGLLPKDAIPSLDRSAHLLFGSDILPACPNSVIEALACGLPVCAFSTGALPEIVQGDAGRLAEYGGDPWKLEPPDLPSLVGKAVEILSDLERFRKAARARAVEAFGLETMVDGYLKALGWT